MISTPQSPSRTPGQLGGHGAGHGPPRRRQGEKRGSSSPFDGRPMSGLGFFPMLRRRHHSVICLVALSAYMFNVAAVIGGAVLCEDPAGVSSLEFGCDHDHCPATVITAHEHDSACWCSACPCVDEPLELDVATVLRDDDARTRAPGVQGCMVPSFYAVLPGSHRIVRDRSAVPGLDRSLRHLRTVVLIV